MRGLVIFLLTLVGLASFSFLAVSMQSISSDKGKINENTKELEFSTFTTAVCEDKGNVVHCKDEFFVNCNGKVSKALDVAECNGIKVEAPKILGFAVFGNDWKDPRN